jgi:hypothetical protein
MATAQKKSGFYFYLAIIFSIGVLAYSAWLIFSSVISYEQGQTGEFYYGLILGAIGVGLSVSSLSTMRRRMQTIKTKELKNFTVEYCEKCYLDYVYKKIGACPQCKEELLISQIYSEYPKEK